MKKTLLIPITAFVDKQVPGAVNVTEITPDQLTQFAVSVTVDTDLVMISDAVNPPALPGFMRLLDVICFSADEIDVSGFDSVLVIRHEGEMTDQSAQSFGQSVESFMDQHVCSEFATIAIDKIGNGQTLFGKWSTSVLARNYEGKWEYTVLGFTSVEKSTDGDYGVLLDGQMTKIEGATLVSTLLVPTKLTDALADGYTLTGSKKAHLVRAPISEGGAFAVVSGDGQVVYDDSFQIIGSGETGFTTLQAINARGVHQPGIVTTVSSSPDTDTYDVRTHIPAKKAGGLGQAYGARS